MKTDKLGIMAAAGLLAVTGYGLSGVHGAASGESIAAPDTAEPSPDSDEDGDGVSYAEEILAGTDPLLADSDLDGYTDGDELMYLLSDPLDPFSPDAVYPGTQSWTGSSSAVPGVSAFAVAPVALADNFLSAWTEIGAFVTTTDLTRTLSNVYDGGSVNWRHILPDGTNTNGWRAYSGDNHTVEFWSVRLNDDSIVNCCELDAYAGGGHYGIKHVYQPTSGYNVITWDHRMRKGMTVESCAYKFAILESSTKNILWSRDISMAENNISSAEWKVQSVVLPPGVFGGRTEVEIALIPLAVNPQDGGGAIIKDVKFARLDDLMPELSLHDLKSPDTATDDVAMGTNLNETAWIEAHSSATDPAPRMPQLALRTTAINRITGREPEGARLPALHVQWQLQMIYNRPTGGRPDMARIRSEDIFTIRGLCSPVVAQQLANQGAGEYRIFEQPEWIAAVEHGFFGGSATLSYVVLPEGSANSDYSQSFIFSIMGRNPDEARCKDYIQGRPNARWFYYAIAKHESNGYNDRYVTNDKGEVVLQSRFYNQFWEADGRLDRRAHLNGEPLWCSDGRWSAGGFGMFQVTGRIESIIRENVSIPGQFYNVDRNVLWNWQANVTAACDLIGHKYDDAMEWMTSPGPKVKGQRYQAFLDSGNQVVNVPNETVAGVTFSDTGSYAERGERFIEDAVAIKAYNGASSHYCAWKNAKKEWKFNREFVNPRTGRITNYVLSVCQQVDSDNN